MGTVQEFSSMRELTVNEIDHVNGGLVWKVAIYAGARWAMKEFAKNAVKGAGAATGAGAVTGVGYGVGKATGLID